VQPELTDGEGGHHFVMFGREEVERVAGVEEPDGCLPHGCSDWWRTGKGKSGRRRAKMSARTNEQRERRPYVVSSTPTSIVVATHCSELPPSDELHESSPFAARLNTGCLRESISSLSSTSEGTPGREKSNAQGLSGDSCFPGGEVYSRAAGFCAHLLGPMAVDVARDHGAEAGHLWAMEEEGEINRYQEAGDIECLALTVPAGFVLYRTIFGRYPWHGYYGMRNPDPWYTRVQPCAYSTRGLRSTDDSSSGLVLGNWLPHSTS
jgi:hypothetical protein